MYSKQWFFKCFFNFHLIRYTKSIFSARLIELSKNSLRPITIGDTLRRICLKIVNKIAIDSLQEMFPRLPFGAGARCAAEIVIHRVKHFKRQNPSASVLKIDFSNAFNCVRRDVILERVVEFMPWTFKYIQNRMDQVVGLSTILIVWNRQRAFNK